VRKKIKQRKIALVEGFIRGRPYTTVNQIAEKTSLKPSIS